MEQLFELWAKEPLLKKQRLSANGSNRIYFRLQGETHSCIAAINADVRENEAFFYYSEEFLKRNLRVPEVYAISADRTMYLQQDLGDTTLYGYLTERRGNDDYNKELIALYQRVLTDLVDFQVSCKDLDFQKAYPRSDFDRQSIQWDLNYFKYYFLKMLYVPFNEQLLEDDYSRFIDYLLDEDCSYFLYRDFQARNIMIAPNGDLYYIDFQGGRRGAAQYDVAALLYSAKSEIPDAIRGQLLDFYITKLSEKVSINPVAFRTKFYGYVLVRMMQAMGAYGYRGYFEKKDYFVRSIPLAVANLRNILRDHQFPIEIPELTKVWNFIINHEDFQPKANKLTVRVFSFSFKKGYPPDKSGNGGGFVFDCRALPNPGRFDQYKLLTGKDQPVIDFLEDHKEIAGFLDQVQAIVGPAVENYIERGFSNLMVNFGCTGGRHRSVYCAEKIADFLRNKYDCRVVLRHLEQPDW